MKKQQLQQYFDWFIINAREIYRNIFLYPADFSNGFWI